ncbi:MAG: STAS domain-containing protein [Ignavibacteria bacterium]|nr:STAS domain-containing protein [Ignavibacteria bacterium]
MEDLTNLFEVQNLTNVSILKSKTKRTTVEIAASLKELLNKLIAEEGRNILLIDLSEVELVESSFLGAIVYAYKETMQRKGTIKVLVTNAVVYDRFILTQLDKLFEIFNNREEALKSFE